jgi:hypothetical protein
MNNQTNQQTSIDLTPECTSVIFATPLNNATNIFPIGTIIWLYNLGEGKKPSLSNSDWKYYKTSDNFFIGRDANYKLGGMFGQNKITLNQSNIPDHIHHFQYPLYKNLINNCNGTSNPSRGTLSCPDGNIFDPSMTDAIQQPEYTTESSTQNPSSFDILPPYQPLFCIKKTSSNINDIPIGSICAWNSQTIPKGWLICDGKDGTNTPNLTSVFILNKDSESYNGKLEPGGNNSVTLTSDNIDSTHTHKYHFQQYVCGHNLCIDGGYNTVSDCGSGQDSSFKFPNVAMCDTNGGNCINSPNLPTPIKLDPPHIKLIYIIIF